jgi:hypothetical protein
VSFNAEDLEKLRRKAPLPNIVVQDDQELLMYVDAASLRA